MQNVSCKCLTYATDILNYSLSDLLTSYATKILLNCESAHLSLYS